MISKAAKLLDKIMHFALHNGFLFTVAVMALVHFVLMGIMGWAGLPNMIFVNLVSVLIYLICVLLCRYGKIMTVYIIVLAEVTVYTVYSIYYLGWKCGAICFLCSIVPIIIYFGCYIFKGVQRWCVFVLLVMNFSLYIVLYVISTPMQPVYELAPAVNTVLSIFSAFAMVFAMIFYNVLYIYASESERNSLEKKNEQLTADANIDALTGLFNRRGFMPFVEELMKNREKSHFCIAFCDIDDFKHINDSYGHDAGDEVLKRITGLIKKDMNDCDVCRWGGEEIVILMKDYDMDDAKEKMEYIRKLIESTPTVFYNKYINATITIGVEEIKDIYDEPDKIIKKADERMYYGKQHGKNVVIYEDL